MKLSIVVPVYKTEKYIRNCIDSLIHQTFQSLEIILVDDGSPDGCSAICDDYAQKYSKVRVIHKENGGLVSARKAGAKIAKGEYITFVDSDDWVNFDYYENIFADLKDARPELIRIPQFYEMANGRELISRTFETVGYFDKEQIENEIFPSLLYKPPFFNFGMLPTIWSVIFKKDLFVDYLLAVPDEIRTGEDLAFTLNCTLVASNIYVSGSLGYHYRENPTSITHTYNISEIAGMTKLFDFLNDTVPPQRPSNLRHQLSIYSIYMLCGQAQFMLLASNNLKDDVKQMRSLANHQLIQEGLKAGVPAKAKFIVDCISKNKIAILKMIKTYLRAKRRRQSLSRKREFRL